MIKYDRPAELSAFQAVSNAQKLAFSPIAFQASIALLRLGVLAAVAETGENGASAAELAERLQLSEYGVRVLLDMGLSVGLVWLSGERYVLDKTGYFLLNDEMTQTNMNFVADVCYEPMSRLQESIEHGAPRGLAGFGAWPTIYPGLRQLPEPARTSWFRFDHFYSIRARKAALDIVFRLATDHGIVLLNGGGFEAPNWSARISFANLDDHVYDDIGRAVRAIARGYVQAYEASKGKPQQ